MYNVNYVCVIYVLSFFEIKQTNWLKLCIFVMNEIVKVVKLLIVLYYFFLYYKWVVSSNMFLQQ